jgi:KaiC/GvpD/RAD55 family RecA-like ATPase
MIEKYGLYEPFEQWVLYQCSASQKFWNKIGQHMNPEACDLLEAKPILSTCRALAREGGGSGPGSTLMVVQRLKREVNSGKVTMSTLDMVSDLYDTVDEMAEQPDEEHAIAEMVQVLRKHMELEAVEASVHQAQKGGDFSKIRQRFEQAARLGQDSGNTTHRLGSTSFQVISRVRQLERLSYGVPELDSRLDGGMPRKSLGVWVGDSGAGKSMHLASHAGSCMRAGVFTGFVTVELPEHLQMARILSHLTGVEINSIVDNPQGEAEAQRRLEMVEDQLGVLALTELAEQATTVPMIERWIEETEQEYGAKMEVLVVDYADRMRSHLRNADNEYMVMRHVYEGLHSLAKERDMYVWTASQATRPGKDKSKYIEQRHVADSMHKARACDVMISINGDPEDEGMYEYYIAKNRLGRCGFAVGPIFVDYSMARVSPCAQELGPW